MTSEGIFRKQRKWDKELDVYPTQAFWDRVHKSIEQASRSNLFKLELIKEARKDFYALIQTFPDLHEYFEEEAKEVADNWRDNVLKLVILKWFGDADP